MPSDNEFLTLISHLSNNIGNKLKENGDLHWISPNSDATNECSFFAAPAGWRFNGGGFGGLNYYTRYWTTTEFNATQAYVRLLDYGNNDLYRVDSGDKVTGYSIRCLKDQ